MYVTVCLKCLRSLSVISTFNTIGEAAVIRAPLSVACKVKISVSSAIESSTACTSAQNTVPFSASVTDIESGGKTNEEEVSFVLFSCMSVLSPAK